MSIIILPKLASVCVILLLQTKLGNGIVADTGCFGMLWRHSNTIYGREMQRACAASCDARDSGTWLKKNRTRRRD